MAQWELYPEPSLSILQCYPAWQAKDPPGPARHDDSMLNTFSANIPALPLYEQLTAHEGEKHFCTPSRSLKIEYSLRSLCAPAAQIGPDCRPFQVVQPDATQCNIFRSASP